MDAFWGDSAISIGAEGMLVEVGGDRTIQAVEHGVGV
jgi:hypothetical protein